MPGKEKPLLLEKEKPPRVLTAVKGADGLLRCPWPGSDPLYLAYHDEEWGVPEYDDRAMFEKLVLDGFQAGLSWITILRKRPAFRKAFDGFDPKKIVRWSEKKKDALMQDAGIVRNRAKIESTVALARITLDLADKGGLARHLWSFVDGHPIQNARRSMAEMQAESEVSRAIAKDLRSRGGNFVGPTIIYAFMQATGMVNDHLVDCCRHEACRKLARELKL
ncbi:MAG TPA: DNA-3-methyladenine glycosylase I [Roseiarcus sp.]|jgi:DNA-3-methyladenine glycosylase I